MESTVIPELFYFSRWSGVSLAWFFEESRVFVTALHLNHYTVSLLAGLSLSLVWMHRDMHYSGCLISSLLLFAWVGVVLDSLRLEFKSGSCLR
jgi:hypothetical protein